MKFKSFNLYYFLSAIILLGFQISVFADSQTGIPETQCKGKVERIENEFARALGKAGSNDIITTHYTCKPNPCAGDALQVVQVTSLSATDWHNSGPWAVKEAQRYNFGSDNLYVDTTTGYGALRCQNGDLSFSNWRQWINSGTFTVNNNSQCEVGVSVDFIGFCGDTFNFGTEHYCTYHYFYDNASHPSVGTSCTQSDLPTDDAHNHFKELTNIYGVTPE